MRIRIPAAARGLFVLAIAVACSGRVAGAPILAGVAKRDITHPDHPAEPPLFAKALAIENPGGGAAIIVTIDAVAIGEIGPIRDPFLKTVRDGVAEKTGIDPEAVVVNASHCHGIVCGDVADRTIAAILEAWENRVPVRTGAGVGHEDQISVNRRIRLDDGSEADVRHAYAMPSDRRVAAVGPIDPEIGLLRFDRESDGTPLALVYQFAVHPILGIPGGGNTSDLVGFASQTIEENLGDGAIALFLQGCGGDINPVLYKATDRPHNAETLGHRLGLAALRAAREIETGTGADFAFRSETLAVPRADLSERIEAMGTEIDGLVDSFAGTSLNFEEFLPLLLRHRLSSETPSAYAHRYLQDEALGRDDWERLDERNRKDLDSYLANIERMEELVRKQINLALLEKHQERNTAAGMKPLEVEVAGLRVGEFRLVTFPAEVTVPVGLNIKQASPHPLTFVSGYTNGYHYYAPTVEQLRNRGGAQEDSDCLLAPEWQEIFENAARKILSEL